MEPERYQILKKLVDMRSQPVQVELHEFELFEVQIEEYGFEMMVQVGKQTINPTSN